MIEKEKQNEKTANQLKQQGNSAEEQMAFYLRRAFADNKDVWVFNDLYVEHNGEIAQIDHLVLFKYGSFIIESKSCLGEISYNKYDEWKRKTKSYQTGFQSPIKQVERQYDILIKNLNENTELIFGKIIGGIKMYYGGRVKQSVIAIEDNSIINREDKENNFDEIIMKSDSVTGFIKERIKKYSFFNNLNPFSKIDDNIPSFTDHQIKNLIKHLKEMDKNIRSNKNTIKKETSFKINKQNQICNNICQKCNNEDVLELKGGRYGYYLHCHHCKNNQNIKESCPDCKNKNTKIKKFKHLFYLDCECGFNELYFKNK